MQELTNLNCPSDAMYLIHRKSLIMVVIAESEFGGLT